MKNFGYSKTGHTASDAYFENQPIWFDIDMMRSCLLGVCIGVIITSFVMVLCL